jgi:hypothetical protein
MPSGALIPRRHLRLIETRGNLSQGRASCTPFTPETPARGLGMEVVEVGSFQVLKNVLDLFTSRPGAAISGQHVVSLSLRSFLLGSTELLAV